MNTINKYVVPQAVLGDAVAEAAKFFNGIRITDDDENGEGGLGFEGGVGRVVGVGVGDGEPVRKKRWLRHKFDAGLS